MFFVKSNIYILLFVFLFNPIFAVFELNFDKNISCGDKESMLARDYCKKLNKHVEILKKFNELNRTNKIVDLQAHNNLIFNMKNIEYKNELIKLCIIKMVEQSSLEPFFKTWDYAYSLCISNKDIVFVREFSIVIFSLYENLLTVIFNKKVSNLPEQSANNDPAIRSLLEDIIQVYNAVSELPIKEIIVTLEKCYVLFSKIISDYGVSSGLNFKQWIKKYWWLPPTIFVAIIGALFTKKITKKINSELSKFYYLNKDKVNFFKEK